MPFPFKLKNKQKIFGVDSAETYAAPVATIWRTAEMKFQIGQ